jgi:hypothetical protein
VLFSWGFSLELSSFNDKPIAKVLVQIDALLKLSAKALRYDFNFGNPSRTKRHHDMQMPPPSKCGVQGV